MKSWVKAWTLNFKTEGYLFRVKIHPLFRLAKGYEIALIKTEKSNPLNPLKEAKDVKNGSRD